MFSISIVAKVFAGFGIIACAACSSIAPRSKPADVPASFYTVTGEIALSRHQPRIAALEYAAAAEHAADPSLLERAADVTAEALQPSLTVAVAGRWIEVDPGSVAAQRAAAGAALELDDIDRSAAHYRAVLTASPRGMDMEFAALETALTRTDNEYGARRLADRLARDFPASAAVLRLQAYAALRADDPAAAVRSFNAVLAAPGLTAAAGSDLTRGLWRARVLCGDVNGPLSEARATLLHEATPTHRMDYALLLLSGQQNAAARVELVTLTHDSGAAPAALRLLGLLDFQDGRLAAAATRFAELVTTGKYLDDALYYLGMIAERHEDWERALRLYAEVPGGESSVPALLRAAAILRLHGAAAGAADLLDRLIEEQPQRAPEILVTRARLEQDAGDARSAGAVLEQGLLQYPDSVELRYAFATLHEQQGNLRVALRELAAVVERRPDDPAALNAYGFTLADHRRHLGEAYRLIARAHAAAPKNAAILDSFGWVLFRQRHDADALKYLSEAYADDRSGDIAAHLGEVLWRLGRPAEAERVWSEGAVAEPANPLLNTTRQRLHAAH